MMPFVKCLDYQVINESVDSVIKRIKDRVQQPGFEHITTLNPEIVARSDSAMSVWIQSSWLCTADGVGIVWASSQSVRRTTGIALANKLLTDSQLTVYCLGGTKAVIQEVANRYPIIGYHHGYFTASEWQSIIRDINQKKPDIILVGLGFPNQESILQILQKKINHGIGIGVGGVFDVLSGSVSRAPNWIQQLGFEWLYRSIQRPSRIVRHRFLIQFLWKVWTFNSRVDPK